MTTRVVDLFCGVGGMTHGFLKEGFKVVAGVDLDRSCRFAYETNNGAKFIERDITTLKGSQLSALYPATATKILVGCAPCQPFSTYTSRKSIGDRWKLLESFARLVEELKPTIVSMENVPRLTSHRVFDNFVTRLEAIGYNVTYSLVNGLDYGIPQQRTRLVAFGSLLGEVNLIPKTHSEPRTVRDVIGHLPAIGAGSVSTTDPLHRARALTPINLRRIRAAKPGRTWETWDDDLKLACHQSEAGKSFQSVYGRMEWDKPAPVMTTQFIGIGNGRFGHPEQDRAISLREGAAFQTFPKSYQFIDPAARRISMQAIARQIGNAVPVRLGRIVARSIRLHLEEHNVILG